MNNNDLFNQEPVSDLNTLADPQNEIKNLCTQLALYNDNYHTKDISLISDEEYFPLPHFVDWQIFLNCVHFVLD